MSEGFDLQSLTDRVELPPFTEREDHGELFRHTYTYYRLLELLSENFNLYTKKEKLQLTKYLN